MSFSDSCHFRQSIPFRLCISPRAPKCPRAFPPTERIYTFDSIAGRVAHKSAEAKARYILLHKRASQAPNPTTVYPRSIPYEMVFKPSDCFKQLSCMRPGEHGYVFIYDRAIARRLLGCSTFWLSYKEPGSPKKTYGLYKIEMFFTYKMQGQEFNRLSGQTRRVLTAYLSGKQPGDPEFTTTHKCLSTSHLELPCYFLQCLVDTRGLTQEFSWKLGVPNIWTVREDEILAPFNKFISILGLVTEKNLTITSPALSSTNATLDSQAESISDFNRDEMAPCGLSAFQKRVVTLAKRARQQFLDDRINSTGFGIARSYDELRPKQPKFQLHHHARSN